MYIITPVFLELLKLGVAHPQSWILEEILV